MVYLATTLIFITSVITLYALILNRKNPLILMVLIPALLTSGIYTGYSIYVLQGTPISIGLPTDTQVEIVWMEPAKPVIRLLLRLEDDEAPTYYSIDYTEKNMQELNKAIAQAAAMGKEGVDGEFKPNNGGEETGGEFFFVQKPKSFGPLKKQDQDKTPGYYSEPRRPNGPTTDAEELADPDRNGIGTGHATPNPNPIFDSYKGLILEEDLHACDTHFGCGP